MLDYEWGNPSTIMLPDDGEPGQDSGQTPQIFNPYSQTFNDNFINPNQNGFNQPNSHHFHHQKTPNTHFQSLYNPSAYLAPYPPPNQGFLSLEPFNPGTAGYMVVPKSEPTGLDYTSRIGLNLGGRTYFSSSEDDFVNRLFRRSRTIEQVNMPRCQAEGCNADLTHAKHYHRRHKVCDFHSKAATVIAGGLTQRFCQQCSRFHLLSEFDNGKRSCRRRLADHNRRRRKSQQTNQDNNKSQLENVPKSSSEIFARYPPDSGAHSVSSVAIAISPPQISLDTFRQWSSNYQSS